MALLGEMGIYDETQNLGSLDFKERYWDSNWQNQETL